MECIGDWQSVGFALAAPQRFGVGEVHRYSRSRTSRPRLNSMLDYNFAPFHSLLFYAEWY